MLCLIPFSFCIDIDCICCLVLFCEGMVNGMGGSFMSPQGPRGSPIMMANRQRPPFKGAPYPSPGGPGMRPPMGPNMSPYPGMTPIPFGQTPQPVGGQSPHPGAQIGPNLGSPAPHSSMAPSGMHVTQPIPHVLPPGNCIICSDSVIRNTHSYAKCS